jgi:hypothetical protein
MTLARGILRRVIGVLLLGMAALFLLAFHDRYWRWRDCFNELGRCYDPVSQDVYLEQAGLVWGSLTAIAFLAGIILLLPRSRRP